MEPTKTTPPPETFFLQSLANYWQILTVKAACELNLPDQLNNGPLTVEEIAARTGTHAPSVYRVMRSLANVGVFTETVPRTFAHSPLSELMRADVPQSFRWMILSEFAEERFPAWMKLTQSMRTGEIAFDHLYGKNIWQFYAEHPDRGELFAKWMTGGSRLMTGQILEAFDFSPYSTIVDVAGGQGAFLEAILARHPQSRGILFDLPMVIEPLADRDRITRVAGDAFTEVPSGGDLYTIKFVIHDWEEEKALQILRNIRKAIKPNGKLMLIEGIVSADPGFDFVKWMDINMLTMAGGRERTEAEYRDLLHAAGFELESVTPTGGLPALLLSRPIPK